MASTPFVLQDRDQCVGCLGLVQEVVALDARRSHQRWGGLKRHADEADLHTPLFLDPVGRQGRFAGAGVHGVGRQPLEVGSGEGGLWEEASVDRVATTVLEAKELSDTLVKLVVADAGHVQLHQVQGLH